MNIIKNLANEDKDAIKDVFTNIRLTNVNTLNRMMEEKRTDFLVMPELKKKMTEGFARLN